MRYLVASILVMGISAVACWATEGVQETIRAEDLLTAIPADSFEADVYPSQQTAAQKLGERWARRLAGSLPQAPTVVRIRCTSPTCPTVQEPLLSAIRSSFPGADCRMDEGTGNIISTSPATELWGLFDLRPTKRDKDGTPSAGTLVLQSLGAGALNCSVDFVEKPWADHFTKFAAQSPLKHYLVAESSAPSPTQAEASREARLSAVDSLLPILRMQLTHSHGSWKALANDVWLRRSLESELARDRLVADRFMQRFERPYGSVWRETILMDVSDPNIRKLTDEFSRSLIQKKQEWAQLGLACATLFVLIYLLYRFTNAVTRGYFVWRLRTAAVVLAFIGLLVIAFSWVALVPNGREPVRSAPILQQAIVRDAPEHR